MFDPSQINYIGHHSQSLMILKMLSYEDICSELYQVSQHVVALATKQNKNRLLEAVSLCDLA